MAARSLLVVFVMFLSVFARAEEQEPNVDPWQGINQQTFAVNEGLDRILVKPVARTYTTVVPGFARQGVNNFFSNVGDVSNGVNNLLQGKPLRALSDLGRIVINSTLGLGGLFDPASGIGLRKHNESFGQTLSVWGVPKGPYVVMPFLGPSTLTDAIARPLEATLDPVRYLYPVDHRNTLLGVRLLDQRAGLLAAESVVFGDRYLFLRDAYLQRREFLVNDGQVEDDFDDF